jgi:hypothetical protein
MSSETDIALRETFEKHRTALYDEQLVAAAVVANTHDFEREYVAHRNGVMAPTLQRLKKLVGEYGHNLLIEDDVSKGSPRSDERGPIQATLLLAGYDSTYKRASPQLRFSANPASRTIAVYASDSLPHKDGVSGQQAALTLEELSADKIEEIFLGIVQRALAH